MLPKYIDVMIDTLKQLTLVGKIAIHLYNADTGNILTSTNIDLSGQVNSALTVLIGYEQARAFELEMLEVRKQLGFDGLKIKIPTIVAMQEFFDTTLDNVELSVLNSSFDPITNTYRYNLQTVRTTSAQIKQNVIVHLRYRLHGSEQWHHIYQNASDNNIVLLFTVENLIPNKTYEFQARLENLVVYGNWSSVLVVNTPVDTVAPPRPELALPIREEYMALVIKLNEHGTYSVQVGGTWYDVPRRPSDFKCYRITVTDGTYSNVWEFTSSEIYLYVGRHLENLTVQITLVDTSNNESEPLVIENVRTKTITELDVALKNILKQFEFNISALSEELDLTNQAVAGVEQQTSTFSQNLQTVQSQVNLLEDNVTSISSHVSSLQQQVDTTNASVDLISKRFGQYSYVNSDKNTFSVTILDAEQFRYRFTVAVLSPENYFNKYFQPGDGIVVTQRFAKYTGTIILVYDNAVDLQFAYWIEPSEVSEIVIEPVLKFLVSLLSTNPDRILLAVLEQQYSLLGELIVLSVDKENKLITISSNPALEIPTDGTCILYVRLTDSTLFPYVPKLVIRHDWQSTVYVNTSYKLESIQIGSTLQFYKAKNLLLSALLITLEGLSAALTDLQTGYTSLIQQTADSIATYVNDNVNTLQSQIQQTADSILLRVSDGLLESSVLRIENNKIVVETDKFTVNGNAIINGTITGDKILAKAINAQHIQANTITADSGIIADLLITDAKIASLSASKLTAGTIDTSQITIRSQDGYLQIYDNQIEIYQPHNLVPDLLIERVHIGRYTDNDGSIRYGFVVFGQDGQSVLIDENGLRSGDAILPKIIDNLHINDQLIDGRTILTNAITADHIVTGAISSEHISLGAISSEHISTGAITSDHITSWLINATHISASSINTQHIAAGLITSEKIQVNAITSDKIAAGAVNATHIQAGTITSQHIATNAITANNILASTITGDKILVNTIATDNIQANAVTSEKILSNAVTAEKILAGAITTDKIIANLITTDKILANAVTTEKLSASLVTSEKILANAVTTDKLAANQVTTDKILANAITSDKIAANLITTDKILADSITTDKIAANLITAEKILANAITADKIVANLITSDKILANAITSDKIAANLITSEKIKAGAVVTDLIAANLVTSAKIATNSVTSTHIVSNLVTAAHIQAGAINSAHISAGAIISTHIQAGTINTTHILSELITADKIKAGVINLTHISTNSITSTHISAELINSVHIAAASIDSSHIKAGAINATHLQSGLITADSGLILNLAITTAMIQTGAITDALILNVSANKINAGTINTASVTIQDPDGYVQITGRKIRIRSQKPDGTKFTKIVLGEFDAEPGKYGLLVMSEDGTTTLIDSTGVYSAGIKDGAVTEDKLAQYAVTEQKLLDDAVTSRVISLNLVFAEHISSNLIQTRHIFAGLVTGDKILANAITANSAIILDGLITSAKILDALITTAKIADLLVTDAKIESLRAGKITSDTITSLIIKVGERERVELNGYLNQFRILDEQLQPAVELGVYNYNSDEQVAIFTRESNAYTPDGRVVTLNVPRFVSGRFGKAVMIEEGTTNLFGDFSNTFDANQTLFYPEYLASGKTWADCWDSNENAYRGGQNITVYRIYTKAIDLGFTTTQDTEITVTWEHKGYLWSFVAYYSSDGTNFQAWNKDTSYTVTKYHNCALAQWEGTASLHLAVNGIRLDRSNPPNYWKRIGVTFRVPANTRYVAFLWDFYDAAYYNTQGGWMRNFQLEAKPYPTSFINGTRADEYIQVPITNEILNPSEGTIELWAYITSGTITPNQWHYLFDTSQPTLDKNRLLLAYAASSQKFQAQIYNDTGAFKMVECPTNINEGWHYFAVRWNSNEFSLFVDGNKYSTPMNISLPSYFISPLVIGARGNIQQFANAYFDSIRISNKARSDEEILAAYMSNAPLPADLYTTLKLDFDGTLASSKSTYGLKISKGRIMLGELNPVNIAGTTKFLYTTQFNEDGSGSLANGKIYWDKDGNLTIDGSVIVQATKSNQDLYTVEIFPQNGTVFKAGLEQLSFELLILHPVTGLQLDRTQFNITWYIGQQQIGIGNTITVNLSSVPGILELRCVVNRR